MSGCEVEHVLRAAEVTHVLREAAVTHVLCEPEIPNGPIFQGEDRVVQGDDGVRQG